MEKLYFGSSLVNSHKTEFNHLYSLTQMQTPYGVQLKVLHTEMSEKEEIHKPVRCETLDVTPELLEKIDITNENFFKNFDQFFRFKFIKSRRAYDAIYGENGFGSQSSSYSSFKTDKQLRNFVCNMLFLDVACISYLIGCVQISCRKGDVAKRLSNLFASDVIVMHKKNGHVRKKLSISKNKEQIFKYYPYNFILQCENRIFDDDCSFLIDVLSLFKDDSDKKIILSAICNIKNCNVNLKFADIVASALKRLLYNNDSDLVSIFEEFEEQCIAYKSMQEIGYTGTFRLETKKKMTTDTLSVYDSKTNPAIDIVVDGYQTVYLPTTKSLPTVYALMLSQAYSSDYIKGSQRDGASYYLITNGRNHMMAESKNGHVTSIRQNNKEQIVSYSEVPVERSE